MGRVVALAALLATAIIIVAMSEPVPSDETVQARTTPAGMLTGSVVIAGCYLFLLVYRPGLTDLGPPTMIRRHLAFLIDLPCSMMIAGTIAGAAHLGQLLDVFLGIFIALGYFIVPLVRSTQTIGRAAMGIAVRADDGRLSWRAAMARVALALFWGPLEAPWRLFSAPEQLLHDKATRSRVVGVSYGS